MTTPKFRKRLLDLAVCVALVPLALPLTLLAMLAIRLESHGAALFVQQRVGKGRLPFRLYKLRTMASGTPDVPSHEVGGMQITRVGRFLRRTKLDELPQLINVWNGTMSLVGPRPCLPTQTELISERESRGLFELPPGITGPAQVLGIDMSDPPLLAQIEAGYFGQASLSGDIRLLMQTLLGAGRGDAASRK